MLLLDLKDGHQELLFKVSNTDGIVSYSSFSFKQILSYVLALDNHVHRMSMTDILVFYLVKSEEHTRMLYNAEFFQFRQVKRYSTHEKEGYNGKLKDNNFLSIKNVLL